jgi:hypothetical protein
MLKNFKAFMKAELKIVKKRYISSRVSFPTDKPEHITARRIFKLPARKKKPPAGPG